MISFQKKRLVEEDKEERRDAGLEEDWKKKGFRLELEEDKVGGRRRRKVWKKKKIRLERKEEEEDSVGRRR